MKKLLLLCLLVSNTCLGQENKVLDFSEEIDTQVWIPFKTAYNLGDATAYNALHASDIIRITTYGIQQGKEYQESIIKSFARSDRRRQIDLKFEHRIHSENLAYEVGYYRVQYYQNDSLKKSFGRFNVLLEKKAGVWKIVQDWDVDKIIDVPITEADFDKL